MVSGRILWSLRVLPALALASSMTHAAIAAATPGRIAIVMDTDGSGRTSRIYLANPDGSGVRPVTPGLGRDRDPAFSPSGQNLAYQTNSQGSEQIMIANVDGGPTRLLVEGGGRPQWSRDGQRILFSRRQDNKDRLFVIRADAKQKDEGLKPITDGRIGRWSPDERLLAVATTAIVDKADHWQLRIVPTDAPAGGSRRAVTLPEDWGPVLSLDWSPDGQQLLFSVSRQGRSELYVLEPDSPDPRRVPAGDNPPSADHGSWSPDGKEILFRTGGDPMMPGTPAPGVARISIMKADGTNVRTLWEPEVKTARLHGTSWHRSPAPVAVAVKPSVVAPPVVMPQPPVTMPQPPVVTPPVTVPPATAKVLGPPSKLHAGKTFKVERQRSPVTVAMSQPGAADFVVSVPVLPAPRYRQQRQSVGITLELEDGALYRGNVMFSGAPWVTLQGRVRGAKVRLIDGKQLQPEEVGFKKGFELSLRREGANLVIAINDQDHLSRPVLTAPVKRLSLTLENFDATDANLPLGNIYYREWGLQPVSTAPPAP